MIIFDTSVISALTRISLFDLAEQLYKRIMITNLVFEEYSRIWQGELPSWIQIHDIDIKLPSELPYSLSKADYSNIIVANQFNLPIATDDRPLREYAKSQNIKITGTLGIIKAMKLKNIIDSEELYQKILSDLLDDLYMSDDLLRWANKF